MDTKNLQIADDARRLLRGFAAVESLAAAFEDVGKLELQGVEIQGQIVTLTFERDAVKAELEEAKQKVSDAQAEGKRTLNDTKAVADTVLETANTEASGIISAAQAKAAEAQAASDTAVAEANATLAEISAACDAKRAEVEELEKKAEKARAFIEKLKA